MITPLPFCVYILFSEKDHLLYTGYTTNIERRLQEYNDGHTKSTAWRRPLRLVFCELYLFEADARKREMYLKTTAGKKAVKLMLGNTLRQFGYQSLAEMTIINEEETVSF
jgi:putative endonuclease